MHADQQLSKSLKPRHLSMIAIAGVIGAGLFVGSGAAIQQAGPGILLAYTAAGIVVILVMRMLGEMAAANPETGSFSTYADKALGRWAGFSIGWLYAWFWIIVLGIEATAGAAIMHRWVPGIDQWIWALLLMVLLTLTNLGSVKSYGEFEFWFASIKVAAIVLFLLFGVAAILGLVPGVPAPGLSNLTDNGGFLPNGPGAVLAGILVVVFSFFGAEIATIAAGESENPVDAVKKAVKSTVWRILVFYIGSIAIVVTLLPWNSATVAKSPYVAVIELFGIPGAGTIMDIVVLTSVLSCLNSGLYTASRMLFSLSRRGDAPKSWMKISKPRRAGRGCAGLHRGGLHHRGPELHRSGHRVPVPGEHLRCHRAVRLAGHCRVAADPAPPDGFRRQGPCPEDVAVPLPDVVGHRQHRRAHHRHGDSRIHQGVTPAVSRPRFGRGRHRRMALPQGQRGKRPSGSRRSGNRSGQRGRRADVVVRGCNAQLEYPNRPPGVPLRPSRADGFALPSAGEQQSALSRREHDQSHAREAHSGADEVPAIWPEAVRVTPQPTSPR